MFHSILTILTASSVAIHALLGCCAHHHHGHDPEDEQGTRPALVEAVSGCRHCAAHQTPVPACPTSEKDGESQRGEGEPCDEPDCNFVLLGRGEIVSLDLAISMVSPDACACDQFAARNSALAGSAGGAHRFCALLSPDLLRAQIQVWRL